MRDMGRGSCNKPKTATEMLRDCIQPYGNLYEFYKACKDADIIIHCKDKRGHEITFATGRFAEYVDGNQLRNNKLNKV